MTENRPNLPENDPQAAGERILFLSQNILNNGKRHGAQVELARSLYGEEYDSKKSKVSGWCRGEFLDGSKPLKIKDFQEIVNLFWQKPGGIQTFDEIFELARCIGYIKVGKGTGKLINLLDRTWLENLGYSENEQINNSPLQDIRYPRNIKPVIRHSLLDEINLIIPKAMERRKPVIIFGEPGTGKTTFVDQIKAPQHWGDLTEKRSFYLNGQGMSAHLRAWYQELIGFEPAPGMKDVDLAMVISRRLVKINVPRLIVMDDVSSVEYISLILDVLMKTKKFIVVVTTSSLMVAQGSSASPDLQVTMPGFSTEEAEAYFKMFLGRKLESREKKQFDLLVKTLKGNPLALHFALQQIQDINIDVLLELLNGIDQEIPNKMLRAVFLPLQVGFERLPDELSHKFIRLASMKRFYSIDNKALAALWANSSQDIDFAKTKLSIELLKKFMSPFQPSQDGWKLHEQTHLFAISKFSSLDAQEQAISSNWAERLPAVYTYSEPSILQAFEISKKMGLKSYRPTTTTPSWFQKTKNLFIRSFGVILVDRNYDWEAIQQELTRISSYEYFISYRLQQDEKRYLRNIRIWFISISLVWAMESLVEKYLNMLTVLSLAVLFLALVIYTVKISLIDLPGLWKCLTRWQLIWNSVGKRISDENQA